MDVADQIKLGIGIAFAILGLVILVLARGSGGFNQRRQAGALMLIAAAVFIARGLGYLNLW